jgi:16S rRNA (guanine527-N7)-methyltransferase
MPQLPDVSGVIAADRAQALATLAVSRETEERLDRFAGLLLAWQRKIHLIGPSSVSALWTRHIADSLQLLALAPKTLKSAAPVWADLGTGAGFPGLVIACALAGVEGARVHLVEANAKKAAFLREAVRETGAPAIVHAERIEAIGPSLAATVDVVTARALAPLNELFAFLAPMLENGAEALLPKGQHIEAELTEATKYWNIAGEIVPSKTSATGRILILHKLSRKNRR